MSEKNLRRAIAIDFDGCLCRNDYPLIGPPHWPVIARARQEKAAGAGLILWTCREGNRLQEAIDACLEWGLEFDAINESLPEWREAWHTAPRKVGATEYWDDKAVLFNNAQVHCRLCRNGALDSIGVSERAVYIYGEEGPDYPDERPRFCPRCGRRLWRSIV